MLEDGDDSLEQKECPMNKVKKSSHFLLFFILETMTFAIITLLPYLPFNTLLYSHIGFTAVLLVANLLLRKAGKGKSYQPVVYVLFVAATAVLLSTFLSDELLKLFQLTPTNPQGVAAAKFFQSLLRVVVILVLMEFSDDGWRSLYLNKGKFGVGLAVGAAAFVVFTVVVLYRQNTDDGKIILIGKSGDHSVCFD